jgi:hypothetical protein
MQRQENPKFEIPDKDQQKEKRSSEALGSILSTINK